MLTPAPGCSPWQLQSAHGGTPPCVTDGDGRAGIQRARSACASWRSARMVVQARENECPVTSRTSSERVLKIAGLLPGVTSSAESSALACGMIMPYGAYPCTTPVIDAALVLCLAPSLGGHLSPNMSEVVKGGPSASTAPRITIWNYSPHFSPLGVNTSSGTVTTRIIPRRSPRTSVHDSIAFLSAFAFGETARTARAISTPGWSR